MAGNAARQQGEGRIDGESRTALALALSRGERESVECRIPGIIALSEHGCRKYQEWWLRMRQEAAGPSLDDRLTRAEIDVRLSACAGCDHRIAAGTVGAGRATARPHLYPVVQEEETEPMDNGNGAHAIMRQASVWPGPIIRRADEETDSAASSPAPRQCGPMPEMLSVGLLSVILDVPEGRIIARARREAWPGNVTHVPSRITVEYRVSGLPIAIQTEVRAHFGGPDLVPVQRDQPGRVVGQLYHRQRWNMASREDRKMAELRAQLIHELEAWQATHPSQAKATVTGFLAAIRRNDGPPQARRLYLQTGRPVKQIVYRWRGQLGRFGVHALVPRLVGGGHH